jgi:branched-chain amino acid transport system substrate-binding protein
MSRKVVGWIAVVMVVFAVIVALALRGNRHPESDDVLRIGAILPLTGQAAFLGQEEIKGLEAARALIESQGKQIILKFEDSANAAKQGLSAFQKLTSVGNVDGIIVTHSGVNGPISDYVASLPEQDQELLPTIIGTIVAATKITRNNNVFLRCYPSGLDEARAIAEYVSQKESLRNIAIAYQNDDYGLDGEATFTKLVQDHARRIVLSEGFDKNVPDQRTLAAKIAAQQPDGVYVVGNTPAYASVIRQLRETGYRGQILSGSAVDVGSLRKAMGDSVVRGIVYSSTFVETEEIAATPDFTFFSDRLTEKDTKPNMLNVYSAVSLQTLVTLLQKEGDRSTTELVRLSTNMPFSTILGSIRFDENRDARLPLFVKRAGGLDPATDTLLMNVAP